MTSMWFARKHRPVFFAGLYLAYLVVLYGSVNIHDESIFKLLTRIVAPVIELGFFYVLCSLLSRSAERKKSIAARFFYVAIPLLVDLVYAAQVYSLYLSGNFITVLAIENSAESRIIRNSSLYAALSVALVWWLLFLLGYLLSRRGQHADRTDSDWQLPPVRWRLLAALALLLTLIGQINAQEDTGLIEADYRQTPIVALAHNYYVSMKPGNSNTDSAQHEFAAGIGRPGTEFPLEKTYTYSENLPFKRTGDPGETMNVIVIFTEGTSARLLGSYGGKYPGLTPNIDRLAHISMRVVNYYNHTAATYRGLQGQMTSGYPSAGGDEGDGSAWESENGKKSLSSIRYQSLPMILRGVNYRTYFISPHHDSVGLNTLLRSLGFDKVLSFESISQDVAPGNGMYSVEGALSDGDIFNALQILLSKKTITSPAHPFFMGLYNFGTHAFLDIMPYGVKYGDGSNPVLNRLHNFDYEFGRFLDYFLASAYSKNTILILTADHADYPDKSYKAIADKGFEPLFVDRIPLIIYDPSHQLPATYDAQGRTSIDFAPSLLQLLGIKDADNSFLGTSLFEKSPESIGFAAIGNEFFATDSNGVYPESNVPKKYEAQFSDGKKLIDSYYQLEKENRVFGPVPRCAGIACTHAAASDH